MQSDDLEENVFSFVVISETTAADIQEGVTD